MAILPIASQLDVYSTDPHSRRRWVMWKGTKYCIPHDMTGHPDPKHIFDRLRRAAEPHDANVHAAVHAADQRVLEKLEHHAATVALCIMYYNFARVHQTLRVTPAMEAGLAEHVWAMEELVALLW
jgi:hypothetical protein